MFNKICAFCNEPFETKSGTQIYCKRQHYAVCVICGAKYPIKNCVEYKRTCSKACGAVLRKRTCQDVYGGNAPACSADVRKKMEDTNLARFGTKSAMQSQIIKDKVVKTNIQRYGAASPLQSPVIQDQIKSTNIERYGAENPMANAAIRDKVKQTTLERYGVENASQSEEVRQKRSDNYFAKTGYRHHWANPEVRAKSEATWKQKYGTKHPLQSPEIQQQVKQSIMAKYGVDNVLKNHEVREQIKQTNLMKYGTENPASNPDVRAKMAETSRARFGKPHYAQTDEFRLGVLRDPERLPYLNEFQADPISTIDKYFPEHKPTLKELEDFAGVTQWTIHATLEKFNCFDKVDYVYSYMEREVVQVLKDIDPDIKVVTNTHQIIKPYEIDIYLPDYKIGIECNPTATHNSSKYAFSHIDPERKPTSYDYHKMKSDLCAEAGIFLFHIFGYEWSHSKDIIVSMLRNLLNRNEYKLFARNTYVAEVSSAVASEFMQANHRQGNAQASVRLGLYDKTTNKLVSVMTFGKMRGTIGTSAAEDLSKCWELVRFCNILNTTVVGGASKLFKYFIQRYFPEQIRSFSDRAHTRGTLYETLGFHEIRRSSPNYVWVSKSSDIAYHRINAQKRNLKKFLKDDTLDLSQSEKTIMEAHGYVQVYDSGTITWEWLK